MKQEIIIGVSIATTLAVMFGIKTWLHSLVKFKMDESSILRFFEESSGNYKFHSTEALSAGTNIDTARISRVCEKSKVLKRDSIEKESWCVES